jgi:glycosyltransferase involved in cell wall biosynthesis
LTTIKLSICIPTYNRAPYLRDCLERCLKDVVLDFPFEIVVSDNHSTDDTEEVVRSFIAQDAPIRYVKGDVNTGMIPNMNSALRLGRGEYLTYLADDDRLIGAEIAKVVSYLDANESILVCYAPWHIADGDSEGDRKQFYDLEQNHTFHRRQFADVFNLIVQKHIFPEIGIYRASAFRSAWVHREHCHFCFPMLAHMLDMGDIAFHAEPFYRQIIRSAIGNRQQGGAELAMTAWDTYRGGLEYFLYFGMKRGKIGTSPEDKATMEHLCQRFTMQRMAVAIRLLIARNEYNKAYELLVRMEYGGHGNHPQVAAIRDGLAPAVGLQTLAWHANSTAGVRRMAICGFTDADIIKERFSRVGLSERIELIEGIEGQPAEMIERTIILVAVGEQRQHFLDLGYLPNLVFSQEDLSKAILL